MLLSATLFEKSYWEGVSTSWWKLLLTVLIVLALVAATLVVLGVIDKKNGVESTRSTRDITYGAICLAASYALSFIKLFRLPNAGAITPASILPLLLYCYYFGFRKSLVVSTAYALLQLIQDPYILSPFSALLDYLLPFMAISLAGVFRFSPNAYKRAVGSKRPVITAHGRFFVGVALYFVARYFFHTLSGVFFWSNGIEYLGWSGDLTGAAAWGYSLTYNILYLLPDTAIAVAAAAFVLSSKAFNAFMTAASHAHQNADAAEKHDQRTGACGDERERQTGGRNGACDNGDIDEHLYGDNAGDTAR